MPAILIGETRYNDNRTYLRFNTFEEGLSFCTGYLKRPTKVNKKSISWDFDYISLEDSIYDKYQDSENVDFDVQEELLTILRPLKISLLRAEIINKFVLKEVKKIDLLGAK